MIIWGYMGQVRSNRNPELDARDFHLPVPGLFECALTGGFSAGVRAQMCLRDPISTDWDEQYNKSIECGYRIIGIPIGPSGQGFGRNSDVTWPFG